MGVVCKAVDTSHGSTVALKSLPRADPVALQGFKQEFQSRADISHPNLASLYELNALDGAPARPGGDGPQMVVMDGTNATYRLDFSVNTQILFNTVNYNAVVGNLLSPFLAQPPRLARRGASRSAPRSGSEGRPGAEPARRVARVAVRPRGSGHSTRCRRP